MFFREEWKHQFDRGGPPEGPVRQEHVSNPNLELKLYGEPPKGDTPGRQEHAHAGLWMNKRFANDPAHLFTGTCNRPCALTLRHRTQYVDLSGFGSKIRWYVKISGFHQVRPVLKLADGAYLVGDEPAQVYGDRVTQIDMRFAKVLRFGRRRIDIGVDLYNLFNTNDPAGYEQTFDNRIDPSQFSPASAPASPTTSSAARSCMRRRPAAAV